MVLLRIEETGQELFDARLLSGASKRVTYDQIRDNLRRIAKASRTAQC